jgi:hypothetical protein
MEQIRTIEEVITGLDRIIERSVEENNCIGIFAYVYRRTTEGILLGIEKNRFENPERMEAFDVIFANLYLQAYQAFQEDRDPGLSWLACFKSANKSLSILQHVMMGMNAHISFDLGLAAAEVTADKQIIDLEEDFNRVNEILKELIDEMQDSIGHVSWLFYLLDRLWGNVDEKLIDMGIREFREHAWQLAVLLSEAETEEERMALIRKYDKKTADLNKAIQQPGNPFIRMIWWLIRLFEEKNVGKIVEKLKRKHNHTYTDGGDPALTF